ncbi:1-deoxy-D-xylulose 5-phosphate reductoisomerase [Thermosporothrix hazakensis]|jgi:1-deoxy-D-xylulose-5-phosphate reductoisomerase|uniref:1-deoxy-D-xylulose 5-phosphate reductoisomerase n=1 Tax=Thermosporothrix hazakensis TaxID=644383 RepID=A0A326UCG3_THEHA|nr:1-deoxy-D-xylulose-5-phosphate reductoisomerase [Thermosporothrix hazakensis]PZW36177.1 1-deoxy-D-xylulose 5-phosphate reductoisomerase [Thermosporothrix hazakensis]GCE46828.1 1-deoxy-D-xylulose 5-phosphate reductoisomerase 2 [Thermosporothrix hazakensis]
MVQFPKRIALLGSTGSIGRQTLDIVRSFPDLFEVVALAARSNVQLLAEQVQEFRPSLVACLADTPEVERQACELLPGVVLGEQGLLAVATLAEADVLVTATSGLMGLRPTLAAINAGKSIALANKETLVMAGHIVMEAARQNNVSIVPVDSEHSALWQCLHGERTEDIRKLILTASGGPFRTASLEEIQAVTVEQALAHPTWRMGQKITIDSATLMNKALEVIEAHWLFDIPYEQIEVVIQPESIVHSMVEFQDGSIKMQASLPTMHLPILHALSYPLRPNTADKGLIRELSWPQVAQLHFEELALERFPCFCLAVEAGRRGGSYPAALVGADEEAVALFLEGRIDFPGIARVIEQVLERHDPIAQPDVATTLEVCDWARKMALDLCTQKLV